MTAPATSSISDSGDCLVEPVTHGLILFAHGSLDKNWGQVITDLQNRVSGKLGNVTVKVAFLQDSDPTIFEIVEELVITGCERISITPIFLAKGAHAAKDFPKIEKKLKKDYPETTFEWTDVIGQWEETLDAFAGALIARFSL